MVAELIEMPYLDDSRRIITRLYDEYSSKDGKRPFLIGTRNRDYLD
jgi:hypothetical protein